MASNSSSVSKEIRTVVFVARDPLQESGPIRRILFMITLQNVFGRTATLALATGAAFFFGMENDLLADGDATLALHNGVNVVNLDGAGLMATVVVAHRDNFNAHSFDVTTFYSSLKTEDGGQSELRIIPIEVTETKEVLHLITAGGADCVLQDFRVIPKPAERTAVLITGERAFGRHFADSQRVTFRYYKLRKNSEVGRPALYFEFDKKTVTRKNYCDVNEAFDAELHLGATTGIQQR